MFCIYSFEESQFNTEVGNLSKQINGTKRNTSYFDTVVLRKLKIHSENCESNLIFQKHIFFYFFQFKRDYNDLFLLSQFFRFLW